MTETDPPAHDPDKYGVNTYRRFKIGDRVLITNFHYQGNPGRANFNGREAIIVRPTSTEDRTRFADHEPHSLFRIVDPTGLEANDLKHTWCEEEYMELIGATPDDEAEAIASITGRRRMPTRATLDVPPVQIAQSMHLLERVAEAIYAGGEDEWLSTVDGTPNSASYDYARRALKALGGD